jgi:carboxymethylenebutenolidase
MLPVKQSQLSFDSGGRSIALDAFLPESNGHRHPAVIGLHGSGGGYATMSDPAAMLAAQGFAVYVLHYFDRTGTTGVADKQTAIRNFPAWGKTLWDAISHVARQPQVDAERIGLLGFSLGAYLALSVASVDTRVKAVIDFFGGFPREMKFFMRRLCPTLPILLFPSRKPITCSRCSRQGTSLTKCRSIRALAMTSTATSGTMPAAAPWLSCRNT